MTLRSLATVQTGMSVVKNQTRVTTRAELARMKDLRLPRLGK